ncbi:hypothetical protein CO009_01310 [Candidatus Shapirobacteria bacterium CG_4_8_14_3_um_filter_35_11]|uniref:Uncharacterized protein n=5 Tax=Bacteria candidate phyla TaxID=1783234 RepID=A0A1J5HNH7_9BACT|nr:MAG: hypothetical protein AUK05_03225 [Candidatus Shapirobacteria bacterium CG2_30_35_20]PIV07765.1 MAG: hypothetical protein COS53_00685 [Candidatus Shapirobacteria bacterium CG03_land_8_20_14_0_80_35_14]PIW32606.1 MAG: hypothetical protein COW28_05635 [bacterium (Candidatus Ratteibacteria) CG15_BIG_FIL_POST_REV_8_21_14_020_41_12]PJC80708.1 MAG: hypothetical protein CO009_01310 [Candidatus Shapirobacteria bacterium CG_4_8_14_3_um_filter_35_11]PJE66952.1 MAG: hypothetical protein COU93_01435
MINNTVLQIPINNSFLDVVKAKALNLGFSSLQDYTRFHYTQFINSVITFSMEPEPIKLSIKNAKKYDKMTADILSGKVKTRTAHSVNELMMQLNS